MRLIDGDKLFHKILVNELWDVPDWVYESINNAPTVEAVPLEDFKSMEQTVNKLTKAINEHTIEAIPQAFIEHMKKKYAEAECWMSFGILTELQNHWYRCQQQEQEDGITPSD